MRRLPVALGLQMILWHDNASGRRMRWSHRLEEGAGAVDIAAQMQHTLAKAEDDEDFRHD